MAIWINREHITPELSTRLTNDLTIITETKYGRTSLQVFKIMDTTVAIPYYYGKKLLGIPTAGQRATHQPIKFECKLELYERQQGAMAELKDQLAKTGTAFLNCYTSFGKSVLLTHGIAHTGYLSCVIVTRVLFAEQLARGIQKNSGARVWMVDSCAPPPNPEAVDVIICMEGRFHYLTPALVDAIGTLVLDEADTACVPSCVDPILSLRPRFVIGCTATPERSDGRHKMLDLICGPEKITRVLDKPVKVIKWSTGIKIPLDESPDSSGNVWQRHLERLSTNPERNLRIVKFIQSALTGYDTECNKKKRKAQAARKVIEEFSKGTRPKIIGMCWRLGKQVLPLVESLQTAKIGVDYLSAEKKNYRDSDVLIGTFGKVARGLDEEMACEDFDGNRIGMVLLTATTKEQTLLTQATGRACRSEHPIVVCMVDDNPIAAGHWTEMAKYFTARQFEISHYSD